MAMPQASPDFTVTYSTVNSLDIKLDVNYPKSAAVSGALPGLLWFHGGGLVAGQRDDDSVDYWLKDGALARGWIFMSADYRLLIPFTGHDQIADVVALSRYLSSSAMAAHFPTGLSLDPSSILVAGSSAGGYIARQFAIHASPKPKGLYSLFGMGGDYLSDFWVKPQPDGIRFEGGIVPRSAIEPFLSHDKVVPTAGAPFKLDGAKAESPGGRAKLFMYHLQEGTSLDLLAGKPGLGASLAKLSTLDERIAALPDDLRPLFPQLLASEYPPTVLIHGTGDSVVLFAESELTHKNLQERGVKSELVKVDDVEHGLLIFDDQPVRVLPEADAAWNKAVDFLAACLV